MTLARVRGPTCEARSAAWKASPITYTPPWKYRTTWRGSIRSIVISAVGTPPSAARVTVTPGGSGCADAYSRVSRRSSLTSLSNGMADCRRIASRFSRCSVLTEDLPSIGLAGQRSQLRRARWLRSLLATPDADPARPVRRAGARLPVRGQGLAGPAGHGAGRRCRGYGSRPGRSGQRSGHRVSLRRRGRLDRVSQRRRKRVRHRTRRREGDGRLLAQERRISGTYPAVRPLRCRGTGSRRLLRLREHDRAQRPAG